MKTTTASTNVKRDEQLQEWTEQIKAQQESGMTVKAYCAQNGINIKATPHNCQTSKNMI